MKINILFFISLVIILTFSCRTAKDIPAPTMMNEEAVIPPGKLSGGASGMTQIDGRTYVGIYDLKTYAQGPRVVLMKTRQGKPIEISPVIISEWNDPEGKPTDLESISRIGTSGNEFLMAEAGTWQGDYGRIFHLSIDTSTHKGTILGVVKLPMMHTNDFDMVGDQYEGIACIKSSGSKVTIILAERGGSKVFPTGILRWGTLDLKSYTLGFTEAGMEGIKVEAPGNWSHPESKRDITALHVDDDNNLWASASQDISDSGPFYSVIYQVGKLYDNHAVPIEVFDDLKVWREVSGYKIEALSGPSVSVPNSKISFATEDESFGGNWRAIQ